ncbi:hypothetical protein ACUN0C_05300 [Faunimonas sp. B44]|uniref:hypothetical protein n=1 Tax=Faunimonas sp. B44 TaxID=3461493 RepID=UPI004044CFC1
MISVTAFVDWKAQIHNAQAVRIVSVIDRARISLDHCCDVIGTALAKSSTSARDRFRVQLRLYHGWHRGLAPTDMRLALLKLSSQPNFALTCKESNVIFSTPLEFGERLLNALPNRLVKSCRSGMPQIHLPDTFRAPMNKGGPFREKMVDTAIACDVLCHARSDAKDWRLVLAEDDDLVPALFVAEAWSKEKGGRTLLVRKRGSSRYIDLSGFMRECQT